MNTTRLLSLGGCLHGTNPAINATAYESTATKLTKKEVQFKSRFATVHCVCLLCCFCGPRKGGFYFTNPDPRSGPFGEGGGFHNPDPCQSIFNASIHVYWCT